MYSLSLLEVISIQRVAIHRYGGSSGVRDLGLLKSALAAPRHTMFGEELYPDLASKCAILLFLIVENHPFVDGNKRTAFLSTLRFAEMNSHMFDATEEQLFNLTVGIASGQLDKDDVTAWMHEHLRSL